MIVLAIIFALWPLAAFLGGLAFAPLTGVAALVTSPVSIPRIRVRAYMIALAAFLIYTGASASWSPRQLPIVDLETLSLRSEVVRVGLLLLAGGALIAVAQSLQDTARLRIMLVAKTALLIQLGVVVVLVLFEGQAITLVYGGRPDDEGVQNISRNCTILAAATPFLIFLLMDGRPRRTAFVTGVVVIGVVIALLAKNGAHAGILALGAALAGAAVVWVWPQHGFKIVGGGIAFVLITAPWIFGLLTYGAEFTTANDSQSYRAAIWQRVIAEIGEQPVFGKGVGVLRTIRDPIESGVFAGQFTIPNHSHNMTLQLWAETGIVGAGLLSIAIVLLGWRMPSASQIGRSAPLLGALAGAMLAIACVSFDLWNEWWWAIGALLCVLAAAVPREPKPVRKREAVSISFDGGPEQATR